jgi:DNA-binding GntR family transcriptional regulator
VLYTSLKEMVYQSLKQKIVSGEIKPGDRILEEEIAANLHASRTPVREAVNRLTAEGLLFSIPQKGSFCKKMSKKEMQDLLDVRSALETLAVTQFIRNSNSDRIEKLKAINASMKEALSANDYNECNRLDAEFHYEIALGSENQFLIESLQRVGDFVQIIRAIETDLFAIDKNVKAIYDHAEVIHAIELRNTDVAIRYLLQNIDHMRANIGLKKEDE